MQNVSIVMSDGSEKVVNVDVSLPFKTLRETLQVSNYVSGKKIKTNSIKNIFVTRKKCKQIHIKNVSILPPHL